MDVINFFKKYFFVAYVAFSIVVLVFMFEFPYQAKWRLFEMNLITFSMMFSIYFYLGVMYFYKYCRAEFNLTRAGLSMFIALCMCGVGSSGMSELKDLNWSFDGVVQEKYTSSNHGALALKISGIDYEGVNFDFWNKVNVGDRVKKESFDVFASLNGQRHIFVLDGLLESNRGRYLRKQ